MKESLIPYFCLAISIAVMQPLLASTNVVTVAGFTVGKETTRYTVLASDLPCPITWNPETDSFPQDPSNFVSRAFSLLSQAHQFGGTQRVSHFDVDDIEIQRLELTPDEIRNQGIAENSLSNQWIVAINFYSTDPIDLPISHPICRKHVVMLLNGVCATEEEDLFHRSPITQSSLSRTPSWTLSTNIDLSRSDFPLPEVQWEPLTQPFPLDLRNQASRAKEWLSSSSTSPGALTLTEVHLWRFIPVESIRAAQKRLDEHLHHWEVVFGFQDDHGRLYDIHILLDGTIFSKTNPLRGHTEPIGSHN
jgi:hypothetical protein